ncbi:50S ribosomal protein L17 [Armatimonas rosea]|jgi:large subunit ribosomal protein L17|uniref:50S ribosomal protein L17 n=1 Tax=Armatimonas rosea TaxID=685828 RepID=A0A7W9W990_ARMRO|nr:50S ribosomal protein L17 [Armatimonas rosea]MBB6053026.1 large subunit ribosomal protein L17 [Armatimonas rosea]
MRHRIGGRQFGLASDARIALLKGLLRSMIIYKKIETTEARAKEIQPMVEKLVTRAKDDSVHSRRIARAAIGGKSASDEDIVKELFTVIAPNFKDRPGGYTRMAHKSVRRGDGAPVVVLEFVND